MDADEVRELLAYDAWATRLLFARLAELAPEQLRSAAPGMEWSVLRIAVHVIRTMEAWTASLRAGTRQDLVWAPIADREELARYEERVRSGLEDYVSHLGAEDLCREFEPGLPYGAAVRHLVNHATYHLGQIAACLAGCSVGYPDTDFLDWVRHGRG